jgi:hypothetical protein
MMGLRLGQLPLKRFNLNKLATRNSSGPGTSDSPEPRMIVREDQLNFSVDQLDGQHTLRPLLASFFSAFLHAARGSEQAARAWRIACGLAISVPAILACLNFWCSRFLVDSLSRIRRLLTSRSVFLGSILLTMMMIRVPSLLLAQINVDESQFIASAQKLAKDPVFFRSVDCGTVGPFDIYPLVLPALFGVTPDYASSRLIGIAIMTASIWVLYSAFARLSDDRIARIAVLPIAGILATIHTSDLQHYASEVPTMILVAGAVYCAVRIFEAIDTSSIWFASVGLLAGLSFFSKMQSLPLVFSIATVAFVFLLTRKRQIWWRALGSLCLGAAIPFVLNAIVSGATGAWSNFWYGYIVANRAYVAGIHASSPVSFPIFVFSVPEVVYTSLAFICLVAACLFQRSRQWRLYPGFLAQSLSLVAVGLVAVSGTVLFFLFTLGHRAFIVVLGGAAIFVFLRYWAAFNRSQGDSRFWLSVLTLSMISAGFLSVYVPQRKFAHYLLLLLIPLGTGIASLLLIQPLESGGRIHKNGMPFLGLFIAVSLVLDFSLLPSDETFAREFLLAGTTIRPPEGDFIRSLAPPGASMVVWGWDAELYLAAGMLPATPDTNMRNFFESTDRINAFYRRRFMTDIARNRPEVLVDAAVSAIPLLDQRYRIESLPEVAAYVGQNYGLVGTDSQGKRYFVRKDLPTAVVRQSHCSSDAIRCFDLLDIAVPAPSPMAPVAMSPHAFLEIDFTPEGRQEPHMTVFSNSASTESGEGFELECLDGSEYRLAVGLGSGQWAFSRSFKFPPNEPARLTIEFRGERITISGNGGVAEVMELPKPMADSAAPIRLRPEIRGNQRFTGKIALFEVRRG